MKKHIPNVVTCCNLISGCIATLFALKGDFATATIFIVAGAVFDFFDGMTARLLGVSSPIGKELDSLADVITFGFAPSAMAFTFLGQQLVCCETCCIASLIPYTAFIMAAFSALRLAKFNLDERQAMGFIGLPTPANALFWTSFILASEKFAIPYLPWLTILLLLVSCWLLVCEIPMFALKFKHYGWSGNELRYGFIAVSAALLVFLGWNAFCIIIPLYIITSIIAARASGNGSNEKDKLKITK